MFFSFFLSFILDSPLAKTVMLGNRRVPRLPNCRVRSGCSRCGGAAGRRRRTMRARIVAALRNAHCDTLTFGAHCLVY